MKKNVHHITVNGRPYCQSGLYHLGDTHSPTGHCDHLSMAAALREARYAKKRAAAGVKIKVEPGPCQTVR